MGLIAKMDFTPSKFHYADERKHSKDSNVQKVKENQRKKDVAYSKDIETVNRELCATCPRGMTLDTAAKCPIEVPADPIKCPPVNRCHTLARSPRILPVRRRAEPAERSSKLDKASRQRSEGQMTKESAQRI